MSKKLTYEDKQDIIDALIRKRKHRWNLGALSWFDFEDVEQIIRAHIFKKWEQWDQDRAIEPWVNRIITNQIKNILRNNYSNFLKPCYGCPFNQDELGVENGCSFTKSGAQSTECPLYKKWTKTKKNAYNIKMASSLEGYEYAQASSESAFINWERAQDNLNKELKKVLNKKQYKIYHMLFIENKSEEEVARTMGYKTSEKGRTAGYRQIKNLKKIYKKKAEEILKSKDIF
jgi:DNA-directed RNA polymerase specialized sigma24 family protein